MKGALLVFILLICGCEHVPKYYPSEKQQLANELRIQSARQLQRELGLVPCGSGGGMMDQIHMLALSFNYHKPVNIETGRELLLTAVEKFRANINADERIRPYLRNYPFEPKNIEIRIFLYKPDGARFTKTGELCVISAEKGILEYDTNDLNSPCLKTFYKETYEEALQNANLYALPKQPESNFSKSENYSRLN